MTAIARPCSVPEALDALAAHPGADLLAGGTDLVPALRSGLRDCRGIVALRRVAGLRDLGDDGDMLTVGAGATYADLANWPPAAGLATTASAVGSVQIRNTGTVGGALGTAGPRSDLLTFLTAAAAEVVLAGPGGERRVALGTFLGAGAGAGTEGTGAGAGRGPGELIVSVRLPRPTGPQAYLKLGARQVASVPVVSCALVVDLAISAVRCAVGGVTAVPLRTPEAEHLIREAADWATGTVPATVARRFGELVAAAVAGATDALSDDVYASRAYRAHVAGVLAARAVRRCLPEVAG